MATEVCWVAFREASTRRCDGSSCRRVGEKRPAPLGYRTREKETATTDAYRTQKHRCASSYVLFLADVRLQQLAGAGRGAAERPTYLVLDSAPDGRGRSGSTTSTR